MLKGRLLKTIFDGVKRAFKIKVSDLTPDEDVNDALAKAIKVATRFVIFIISYKLFPEFYETILEFAFAG